MVASANKSRYFNIFPKRRVGTHDENSSGKSSSLSSYLFKTKIFLLRMFSQRCARVASCVLGVILFIFLFAFFSPNSPMAYTIRRYKRIKIRDETGILADTLTRDFARPTIYRFEIFGPNLYIILYHMPECIGRLHRILYYYVYLYIYRGISNLNIMNNIRRL